MTIQQVLYILETAGCSSISTAAARLYISQSALSQQIHRKRNWAMIYLCEEIRGWN